MDETRARVEETRQKMKPAYQKIHEEQSEKIRALLTPEQQTEYDKSAKSANNAGSRIRRAVPDRGFRRLLLSYRQSFLLVCFFLV